MKKKMTDLVTIALLSVALQSVLCSNTLAVPPDWTKFVLSENGVLITGTCIYDTEPLGIDGGWSDWPKSQWVGTIVPTDWDSCKYVLRAKTDDPPISIYVRVLFVNASEDTTSYCTFPATTLNSTSFVDITGSVAYTPEIQVMNGGSVHLQVRTGRGETGSVHPYNCNNGGYGTHILVPYVEDTRKSSPTAVTETTWGRIKSLF